MKTQDTVRTFFLIFAKTKVFFSCNEELFLNDFKEGTHDIEKNFIPYTINLHQSSFNNVLVLARAATGGVL